MNIKFLRNCLFDIYNLLSKYNPSWKCLDIVVTGFPKHPLYLRNDLRIKSFDIENFLLKIKEINIKLYCCFY